MEKHIQLIQDKADQIYEKFKSLFEFQVRILTINSRKVCSSQFVIQEGDMSFWEAFKAEVNEFKEKTAGADQSNISDDKDL